MKRMMQLKCIFLGLFFGYATAHLESWTVPDHKQVFDQSFYDDALDPELCSQQLAYMANNNTMLQLRFYDASFRPPRGFLEWNFADYGNYFQCLAINHEMTDSTIEGKFCMLSVPLFQNVRIPSIPTLQELPEWPVLSPQENLSQQLKGGVKALSRSEQKSSSIELYLAVCIPKTCSTRSSVNNILGTQWDSQLQYTEMFCRLPGDKRWVTADYIFIILFPILISLVFLSTAYDLYQTKILKNDPKSLSTIYVSFSAYTNTRRLVTYKPVPGAIECLDGIRSFAMMWIIIGHTFATQTGRFMANIIDVITWMPSVEALWIITTPITVDTFFMLSGFLLVYTACGKLTGPKLLKNLHLFYLNRFLRILPLLAVYVLIQASLLNWISDGPIWERVELEVHKCRVFWWTTLLHVQNLVNPLFTCLGHSWYLAIDMQLYIISPIFLFWVLGKNRLAAWLSLSAGLIISLAGSTVFNFMNNFQPGPVTPSDGGARYMTHYYVNPLTRASPFFVGMFCGYILHLTKGKKIVMSWTSASTLWACATATLATIIGIHYPIMQSDWDNQIIDNLINSFMRPLWALSLGWIIFACATGYGGPVNWVLSLRCFKVLSRLSYAMYIVHYPLMFVINSSLLQPLYFRVNRSLYIFYADFAIAAVVAYILTMLVDAPCSTLVKLAMGGLSKPQEQKPVIIIDEKKKPNHDCELENK